jgi:hypothetical protein
MADILDRTVTVTLQAVNAAYMQSVNAAAQATNAALGSIQTATTGASESVNALTATLGASADATTAAATNAQTLSAAIDQTTLGFAAQADAAKTAAANTQTVTAATAATATAANNAAAATEKTAQALTAQGTAAAGATAAAKETGTALADTGTKAAAAGENIKTAGEKTSTTGGFFSGLKDEAVKLVPGLGDVLSMAAGVATGMEGLQIAQKVGAYLLDLGEKALTSSGQMAKITAAVDTVKTGFEDLAEHTIQQLAGGISDLIGPALDKFIQWITNLMSWLKALGDWFTNSGTAASVFEGVLSALGTLFAPVTKAVEDLWTNIKSAFSEIQQLIAAHPAAWQAVLTAITVLVTNFIVDFKLAWALIGAVVQAAVFLVRQQFDLFAAGLTGLWQAAEFVWDKLKAGVSAVGAWFEQIFLSLPKPVQDAFQTVAQAIAQWTQPIFAFISDMVAKIPGLSSYKSTFDAVSASLTTFGQKVVAGTAAQKAANDASDAAAAKAKELAAAQTQLGVMTADQTAKATASALALGDAFEKLKNSGTQNLQQLTQAGQTAYTQLETTQQQIAASGTAEQKAALATQLANLKDWAAANGVVFTELGAKAAAVAPAVAALATNPAWDALRDQMKAIGFVSEASIVAAANQSELAWETFFQRSSQSSEATAQFIQKQYTNLSAQIEAARAAGYTAEVNRLSQMAMNARTAAAARGVILTEDVTLWNNVQKAIDAIPPSLAVLDQAISSMGDASTAATTQMLADMAKIPFETDKDVADTLNSLTRGYNAQMALASSSVNEQLRINQAYYDALKKEIDANGVYYNDAQRAQVQTDLQTQLEFAKNHGQTLETIKTQTTQTTEQVSALWQNLGTNMTRTIKTAAGDMADDLITGDKSFGQACKDMLTSLEEAIVKTFLQTGLDAVMNFVKQGFSGSGGLLGALDSAIGKFTSLGKSASDALGSGTSAAGSAGSAAGSATSGGSSAASGIGSALGSIGGVVNVISGAISAIASIGSFFEERGQTKVMENQQNLLIWIYEDIHGQLMPALNMAIIPRMDNALAQGNSIIDNLAHGFNTANVWLGGLWDQLSRGFNDMRTWGGALWDQLSRGFNDLRTALAAQLAAAGAAPAATMNLQPLLDALTAATATLGGAIQNAAAAIVNAVSGIGQLPADAQSIAGGGAAEDGDLAPITNLLAQIQNALTQGSLRPNVALTVAAGPGPQDIANAVVKQLQLAGVMR